MTPRTKPPASRAPRPKVNAEERRARQAARAGEAAAAEREADLREKATDAERRIAMMRQRYSELEAEMVQTRNVIHELIGRRGVYAEELGEQPPLSVLAPLPDLPEPAPGEAEEPGANGAG